MSSGESFLISKPAELTKIIYHRYDSSLFGIASEGIKLHLSHLALLGKVSQESDGWIPNA